METVVLAVDPGRNSGVACLIPYQGEIRRMLFTKAVKVEDGVTGFEKVRDTVLDIRKQVESFGFDPTKVLVVIENQHVRFAKAAIVGVEIRRLWEVYLYEKFQVTARVIHPTEWRTRFDLNVRGLDKKKAAKVALQKLLGNPEMGILDTSQGRTRTTDECEAALMACSFCEV